MKVPPKGPGRRVDPKRRSSSARAPSTPEYDREPSSAPSSNDEETEGASDEGSAYARPKDIEEAIYSADDAPRPRAHLFESRSEAEPGDLRLTDVKTARNAFPSPLAYARHAVVLAAKFRQSTGATREEALEYLTRLFVALDDPPFTRQALRAFGPDTGIIDLYPLEVFERVLLRFPGLLHKTGFGRVAYVDAPGDERPYRLRRGMAQTIRYNRNLKLRGFAIRGGGRPGYRFAPIPGTDDAVSLTIERHGNYAIMLSAITRTGFTIIDRVDIRVAADSDSDADADAQSNANIAHEEGVLRSRDAQAIEAWPYPAEPRFDTLALIREMLGPAGRARMLSSEEIVLRRQKDLAVGPRTQPHAHARPARPETETPASEDNLEPLANPKEDHS
ncbi:MAG: hypothetical protein H6729_10930 [Deltaproteobacteria bacterium]|nr:hypothetical protein [Deltaproteobacteria bacterium]